MSLHVNNGSWMMIINLYHIGCCFVLLFHPNGVHIPLWLAEAGNLLCVYVCMY